MHFRVLTFMLNYKLVYIAVSVCNNILGKIAFLALFPTVHINRPFIKTQVFYCLKMHLASSSLGKCKKSIFNVPNSK